MNEQIVKEKNGVLTLHNVSKFGLGAVVSTALVNPAFAAVDVTAPVGQITTDGTSVITAIGTALLGLAGLAVIFKWAKASFFS
ncbi:major capsid protein [Acinetobacter sp. AM]|uniref:major capsid protein n=1 Tax=Acinetobacter sp. AM TaxID=2170730 RepID=UPI001D1778DA|nr:major capsid protein [Acinetobacter sp. AM]